MSEPDIPALVERLKTHSDQLLKHYLYSGFLEPSKRDIEAYGHAFKKAAVALLYLEGKVKEARPPKVLDAIADVVLRDRPKPITDAAKKRKRKAKRAPKSNA